MKDLKISSKYDNHICTLENGEKLFSAEVTLYSSWIQEGEQVICQFWN